MKKLLLTLLFFVFITTIKSQTDSNTMIVIAGKKISINDKVSIYTKDSFIPLNGEVFGINKDELIILSDNKWRDVKIFDIEKIEYLSSYSGNSKNIGTTKESYFSLSIGAGYTTKSLTPEYADNNYGDGYNIKFDFLYAFKNNWGFRVDLYFAKHNGYSFTNYNNNNKMDPMTFYNISPGMCFGIMDIRKKFNIYAFAGLGIGYEVRNNREYDMNYNNTIIHITEAAGNLAFININISTRFLYRLDRHFSLFAEPGYIYNFSQPMDVFNVNGGLNFTF